MRRFLLLLCLTQPWLFAATGMWLDVPFVSQGPGGCGPASAEMVVRYWHAQGAGEQPRTLTRRSPLSDLRADPQKGVSGSALEQSLASAGFRTFVFQGEEADLEHHIARGRPLIVCLSEKKESDLAHFVVVVGTDLDNGLLYLNDPAQRKLLAVPWARFEEDWKASGNWTLLALPESSD